MNTKLITIVFISGVFFISSATWAASGDVPYVGSKAFEQLKQLAGTWEGTMATGEGSKKIMARYKVTSGGSAIVETGFEETPHEMVTVYHDNPDRAVTLTHYCMLHNQPKMVLKQHDKTTLSFDLSPDADIDVTRQWHMHSVTINIDGTDRIRQLWSEYKDGKPGKSVEIVYKRIK